MDVIREQVQKANPPEAVVTGTLAALKKTLTPLGVADILDQASRLVESWLRRWCQALALGRSGPPPNLDHVLGLKPLTAPDSCMSVSSLT